MQNQDVSSERAWKYEWTPESIARFWRLIAQSPMNNSSFSKQVAKPLVELVSRYIDEQDAILDFGSGDGDFCAAMRAAGYDIKAYEPYPRSKANQLNQDAISPGDGAFGKFAHVTCFEVLEHIHPVSLDVTMAKIADFLIPSGTMLGTVPYSEKLEENSCICPNCAALFHRWQHMRSFDETRLREFMGRYNFRIKLIDYPDFTNSLFFIAEKANS